MLPRVHYIVYDNRSGSTLLAALLNRYKGIAVTPECDFTHRILEYRTDRLTTESEVDVFFNYMSNSTRLPELGIPQEAFRSQVKALGLPVTAGQLVKAFVEVYYAHRGDGADTLIVKTPNIYFHAEKLIAIFPGLKFIHIYRDGRAVFNSKTRSVDSAGRPMSTNPYSAARIWDSKIRRIDRYPNVIHVRYEDVVGNTESTLNGILDQLEIGEDLREIVRDQQAYFYTIGEDQTHLHGNLLKRPDSKHLDKWKTELSHRDILVYETVAGSILKKMGYQLETDANARFLLFYHWARHLLTRLKNALIYLFQGRLLYKLKYQISRV